MNKAINIDITGIGNFNKVKEAVIMANEVLHNDAFYDRIAQHPGFTHANVNPEIVARVMRESAFTMTVDLYYAMSPIRNIDGYDDLENPFVIHMNVWKLDRSPESICNSLIHACVHAANAYYEEYEFGHGDNLPEGKELSAPYWIGALAQQMVSDEEVIIVPLQHDELHREMNRFKKQFTNKMFTLAK